MTSEKSSKMVPFLVRFGQAVPHTAIPQYRYDLTRQLSQVLINDRWVDSPDAGDVVKGTRVTEVKTETTDE